jgi:hypothetical protein
MIFTSERYLGMVRFRILTPRPWPPRPRRASNYCIDPFASESTGLNWLDIAENPGLMMLGAADDPDWDLFSAMVSFRF